MHILGSFRAFGTCSKAFIKLEGLEELTEEEREEYQELAMDIFVKYSPKVETNNYNDSKFSICLDLELFSRSQYS